MRHPAHDGAEFRSALFSNLLRLVVRRCKVTFIAHALLALVNLKHLIRALTGFSDLEQWWACQT